MTDWNYLQKLADLTQDGYLPTLGAWVQVAGPVTTRLNAFNTLSSQHLVVALLDQDGDLAGPLWEGTVPAGRALRLDLATLLTKPPFEGAVWVAAKGEDGKGDIGIQAMDLDFIATSRPAAHVLGTVHMMQDFYNTLGIAPWLDLLSPRVTIEVGPDGEALTTNFLGLAHHPIDSADGSELEIRVANEAGEWLVAKDHLKVPALGSAFLALEVLMPTLREHLVKPGATRGFGTVNVREMTPGGTVGLCAMLKVTDNETGDFRVDHLNDRHFAKPTQKG